MMEASQADTPKVGTTIDSVLPHTVLPAPPAATLAYLLSVYPSLEHTYLLREVRQLRELGWKIQTLSIRRPPKRPVVPSSVEEEEMRCTWYVLGSGLLTHLSAHLATV